MKQLLKKAKLIAVFILALSFQACDDDDFLLPKVVADFTFTLNEDTGTVSFLNTSEEASTFEWDFGDGTASNEINPIKIYTVNGTYTIALKALNVSGASETFTSEVTILIPEPTVDFDSGLLTNGDFENGVDPWIGNAANIQTEGGNSFNLANVETAGDAFAVNLSQVVEITQGTNYILTFDASSDQARTLLAGIGLNVAPFTNTVSEVNLTADTQTFTLQLAANDFGGADSRVLFDMGAAVGTVVIDNVSLVEGGDGSDTNGGGTAFDSGLLANGDFENGVDPWIGNAANVQTEDGNSFNLANVETAGDAFAVNLSQVVAITQGTNYILTFDASSDQARTLLAGIGLNVAPFTNTVSEVNLTTDTQTFTLQLAANDFGGADSRVLFDMGAAVGTVVIDNVSLVEGGDGSDTNGGGTGGGTLVACDNGELVNDFETSDDSIFDNFGGGVGTIIDNSDTSVNSSAKLGQYVKNTGELFGGITIALGSNIDLNNGTFSIDVNSQSVRQLLFKLEGLNQELVIPTSGTGWETIEYDFTGNVGEVTGITLIMDNGTPGDGSADWTIQFDNIRLCDNESSGGGGTLVACDNGELVNDFETSDDSIFNNFGGGVGTIIDNLDTSVNSSAKLGQYVKNPEADFGGITIALDSNIDLNNGTFSIDVNSQSVRQLLFKLEGLNQELIIPTSGTGWETIEYDFTGNVGEVTGITLIMDNGTLGDGSADWTIQFDNIRLCDNESSGGGGTANRYTVNDVIDFETGGFGADFGWNGFENDSNPALEVIANPNSSGINTSATVARVTALDAGQDFAGWETFHDGNGGTTDESDITPFTLDASNAVIRIMVFKTVISNVGIQVVNSTNGANGPVMVANTVINQWEELTFDFRPLLGAAGTISVDIDRLVVFPDFAPRNQDNIILFDNITFSSN